jgi:hypothetical protein
MKKPTSTDLGILAVLAKRLVEQRLPQALALREKVDRGEALSDRDAAFLQEVLEDARRAAPVLDRNPEYKATADAVAQLYKEITAKALENEKAKKS